MRLLSAIVCTMIALAAGETRAADIVYKPIDTQKLVVQPSNLAANLAAQTIKIAGATTAAATESNGWVKTINNVLGFRKRLFAPTQPGGLPAPNMFPSTQFKSFNTPQMPISMPNRK